MGWNLSQIFVKPWLNGLKAATPLPTNGFITDNLRCTMYLQLAFFLKKCTTLNLPGLLGDELDINMSQSMVSRFYTRPRLGACYVRDVKVVLEVKSHELRMCEPKRNAQKILLNLAKTRWRPQVMEPAMAVKDRIRVAKGRFLISSSIRKFGLRDANVFFFFSKRRYSSRGLV